MQPTCRGTGAFILSNGHQTQVEHISNVDKQKNPATIVSSLQAHIGGHMHRYFAVGNLLFGIILLL